MTKTLTEIEAQIEERERDLEAAHRDYVEAVLELAEATNGLDFSSATRDHESEFLLGMEINRVAQGIRHAGVDPSEAGGTMSSLRRIIDRMRDERGAGPLS